MAEISSRPASMKDAIASAAAKVQTKASTVAKTVEGNLQGRKVQAIAAGTATGVLAIGAGLALGLSGPLGAIIALSAAALAGFGTLAGIAFIPGKEKATQELLDQHTVTAEEAQPAETAAAPVVAEVAPAPAKPTLGQRVKHLFSEHKGKIALALAATAAGYGAYAAYSAYMTPVLARNINMCPNLYKNPMEQAAAQWEIAYFSKTPASPFGPENRPLFGPENGSFWERLLTNPHETGRHLADRAVSIADYWKTQAAPLASKGLEIVSRYYQAANTALKSRIADLAGKASEAASPHMASILSGLDTAGIYNSSHSYPHVRANWDKLKATQLGKQASEAASTVGDFAQNHPAAVATPIVLGIARKVTTAVLGLVTFLFARARMRPPARQALLHPLS